jgi:hypothetical protein
VNKRLSLIVLAAGAAAGVVLLTACGQAGQNAGSKDVPGQSAKVDSVASSGDGDEPVNCGDVEVNGIMHTLLAEQTSSGTVGCTEAFNILDEYLAIPAEQRGADLENMPVSDGWACGTDDGEFASIGCVKGGLDEDYEFSFYTTPAGAEEPSEELEPVACGEVDVDGSTHNLVADPTRGGIVGCTEAFTIIDEYLAIPVEQRNSTLDSLPVSNGWSCVTDDGEFASIGCVKGERVNDDYDFAFHTEPAGSVDPVEPVICGDIQVTRTITHNLIADPTRGGIVGCTEAFNIIDEYLAIPQQERSASFENIPVSNGWSCGTDDGEVMSLYCVKGERVNDDYEFSFHTEPV